VRENILVGRSVRVEIVRRGAQARDVLGAVRAEQGIVGSLVRQTPFPFRMRRAQMSRAPLHPRRALRMPGDRIFRAAGIVEDDHALALHETAEVRPIAPDEENLQHRDNDAGHHFFCSWRHADVEEQDVKNNRCKDR